MEDIEKIFHKSSLNEKMKKRAKLKQEIQFRLQTKEILSVKVIQQTGPTNCTQLKKSLLTQYQLII